MNYGIVARTIGKLILIEALCLIFPLLVSLYHGQNDWPSFAITIVICIALGVLLHSLIPHKNTRIKIREAFSIVALGWLFFSLLGALPFYFSGTIPHYIDAMLESIAGFTTTGASVMTQIEQLPRGILFWRGLSHWLGGMGILAFSVAVLPSMDAGSFQILKAEYPGPMPEKIAPRVKDTAKIFYFIYIGLTVAQVIFLSYGGMDLFDAIIHAFGTVSTGGVSSKDASIGYFYDNSFIVWTVTIFMLISGINISFYYFALKTRIRYLFQSEEVRLYLGIIALCAVAVSMDLLAHNIFLQDRDITIRNAIFQVVSIVTTSGFAIDNFDLWPNVSKVILFFLFFVGSCAGSTGGGIKSIRLLVCAKIIKRDLRKIVHTHAVTPIKVDAKAIPPATVSMISSFVLLYVILFAVGSLLISFDGVDLATASSSVAVTLGNIGFGFGAVGPAGDFSGFSDAAKVLLSFFMLVGRLELFTILVLFMPTFWKN